MITTQDTFTESIYATGTDTYPFTFYALEAAHVRVKWSADSIAWADIDPGRYNVTGLQSNTGGSIQLFDTYPAGARIRVYRDTRAEQDYDFKYNDHMPSGVVERALDRCICIVQELWAGVRDFGARIGLLETGLAREREERVAGDGALSARIDTERNERISEDARLDAKINEKADASDPRFHTHANKAALDEISASNGQPTWMGKPWPGTEGQRLVEIDLSGQMDGAKTTFAAGVALTPAMPMSLYYGGQRQFLGLNYTIDFEAGAITTLLDTPPDSGDNRRLVLVVGDADAFPPNAATFPVTGNGASVTNNTPGNVDLSVNGSAKFGADELGGNARGNRIRSVADPVDGQDAANMRYVDAAVAAAKKSMQLPVGSVYLSMTADNPAQAFGYGAWERIAQGRALVGVDEGDADFDAAGKTSGQKSVQLLSNQMPRHRANLPAATVNTESAGEHVHSFQNAQRGFEGVWTGGWGGGSHPIGMLQMAPAGNHSHFVNLPARLSDEIGGDQAHSNVQPSFAIYIWRRTA